MLGKITKTLIHSIDVDTDSLGIVNRSLQGDSFAPYLSIIDQDYLLWTSNKNRFTLKQVRSIRYPAEIMTDVDYADDQVLLTNTRAQVKSQMYSVYQTEGSVRLSVKANKTELIEFWLEKTITFIRSKPLKLVYQFIYTISNIS